MKMKTLAILVGVATPLIVAGSASAGFVGLTVEQLPIDYSAGIVAFRIYAQFDGTQGQSGNDLVWTVADGGPGFPMVVSVRGGTFFQHTANTHGDGDLSPDSVLCDDDPTVCLDTFVTIGRDTSVGDATVLSAGWPGFGPDQLFNKSAGWAIIVGNEQGIPDEQDRVLIMQLSTQSGVGFTGQDVQVAVLNNGQPYVQNYNFDTGCYPDIDGDNMVGICDFLLVLAEWGPCAPNCSADIDVDGEVGILDFLLVLVNWGPCP